MLSFLTKEGYLNALFHGFFGKESVKLHKEIWKDERKSILKN